MVLKQKRRREYIRLDTLIHPVFSFSQWFPVLEAMQSSTWCNLQSEPLWFKQCISTIYSVLYSVYQLYE